MDHRRRLYAEFTSTTKAAISGESSMPCLAIECSSDRRSVAVTCGTRSVAETSHTSGRETPLLEMIDRVLQAASLTPGDLTCLAVGLGPGSYTGVRIAIATAQGWELAHRTPLIGIDSVQAIAFRAMESGQRGSVAIVVDAHRDEFYVAEYNLGPGSLLCTAPLRIAKRDDLSILVGRAVPLFGPDLERFQLHGTCVVPDAVTLGKLAALHPTATASELLQPIYLRSTTFAKPTTPPRVL